MGRTLHHGGRAPDTPCGQKVATRGRGLRVERGPPAPTPAPAPQKGGFGRQRFAWKTEFQTPPG